ncbi:MAG: DivIVA domain-containing protein [Oscillospiraceae bacterium]|jgi:cell division initiation protein
MLTPQEVAEHAFSKATFGGYNMSMVDEFLDLLTGDYTALYKENAALKAKMKVLVEKVEEYRATEDAMRKALLSAQKMADQMVAEAEGKKASVLAEAEQAAKAKMAGLQQEVENEQLRLTAAQNATAAYVSKLKELYQHEMDYLAGLSKLTAAPPKADPVAQTADDIGDAVEKAVEDELPEGEFTGSLEGESLYAELRKGPARRAEEEPEEEGSEEDPEDTAPTRRIDFNNLRFGKDYEIK